MASKSPIALALLMMQAAYLHGLTHRFIKDGWTTPLANDIDLPVVWLHIPKTGMSFGNTLLRDRRVCPAFPDDTVILSWDVAQNVEAVEQLRAAFPQINHWIDGWNNYFLDPKGDLPNCLESDAPDGCHELRTMCPGFVDASLWHLPMKHWGLGNFAGLEMSSGHIMSFFRQPEQRILSAYHNNHHDWTAIPPPKDELEYATTMAGCQVKMVVREGREPCDPSEALDSRPVTDLEVAEAQSRLQKFSFVGLTERWMLSICLFHKKFGGFCQGTDFLDVHQGKPSSYNTSVLGGWVDDADNQLYKEAERIFDTQAAEFGVNEAMCRPCFSAAFYQLSSVTTPAVHE